MWNSVLGKERGRSTAYYNQIFFLEGEGKGMNSAKPSKPRGTNYSPSGCLLPSPHSHLPPLACITEGPRDYRTVTSFLVLKSLN